MANPSLSVQARYFTIDTTWVRPLLCGRGWARRQAIVKCLAS
jgi:hypothetical protein